MIFQRRLGGGGGGLHVRHLWIRACAVCVCDISWIITCSLAFWSAFIQPGAFLHGYIKTVVINLAVKLMSITVLTFIDACNDSDIGQSDFHR